MVDFFKEPVKSSFFHIYSTAKPMEISQQKTIKIKDIQAKMWKMDCDQNKIVFKSMSKIIN